MKKSKVVLAIVLAVVLLITLWNVPTFSWFSRPHSQNGAKTVLGGENGAYSINAYNGYGVSLATYSSNDGVTYSDSTTTNYSGSNIPNNNRKYFKTTLTNNSGSVQNVSLYARTLSIPTANNGTLALGVNGPTRSYRDYSALARPTTYADRDVMRIYFEKDNNVTGWNGTEFYICWNESSNLNNETLGSKGENGTYYKLTHVGGSNNPNQYYADIPKTATHAFFCVENWGTNNNGEPNYWQRSQELCNLALDGQTKTVSKLFKITDTNSNGNATVVKYDNITGNCINHYYKDIFVATGNTFDAALSNTTNIPLRTDYTTNYIGGSLEYYSGDTSVFTVNKTTGVITPVGAGEATLYTKSVSGSYPDEQQVESTVHVTSDSNYVFHDVPIVKNIRMAAAETVDVYWYVINNSPTTALTYTIDEVYISN
ncbi:hypothetical protein [Ruminococcus sp.]|uniref:hypothetical protein n=1 Tax=Ruminococcus sp. TaxID=41978 RepID=UPI00389109A3